MSFLIFIGVAALCYLVWRIMDILPDVTFRLAEMQRDIADIRRQLTQESAEASGMARVPEDD